MRSGLFLLLVLQLSFPALSQVPEPEPATNSTTEQQIENITENNEDQETEDDSYLQELNQFLKHPVNLNRADETDLKNLRVLSPMQTQNLMLYRDALGQLLNIYELQAVPGWDIATIHKIRPYVTVSNQQTALEAFSQRLRGGDRSILVRTIQTLERSRGYLLDPGAANNYYPGSPQRLFLRYKYQYKNLLQYGILAEKDAG